MILQRKSHCSYDLEVLVRKFEFIARGLVKNTCELRPYEGHSKIFCSFRVSQNVKEDYNHSCFPGGVPLVPFSLEK